MKIQDASAAQLADIRKLWHDTANTRADFLRGDEALRQFLIEPEAGAQWYVIPPATVLMLAEVMPGHQAVMMLMAGEDIDIMKTRDQLQSAMREYDLRRITWAIPAPVSQLINVAYRMRFDLEGRMRDGVIYNGQYTDLIMTGFHRSEVEHGKTTIPISGPAAKVDKPKRRRRRRGRRRRKNKVQAVQETATAEKVSAD